jgi:TonB-like protein
VKSLRTFVVLFLALASAGFGLAPANALARHTQKATPKTVAWGYYDAKALPVRRVKSGDAIEIPTLSTLTSAEEEKQPIVYVKHLESPVRYPPLARQTRSTGTIVIKLTIAADGTVLKTESSVGDKNTIGFDLLKDDAERIVKAWTFGCAGCSPNAPFEHTMKFIYKQEDSFTAPGLRVEMNLPGQVTITTNSVECDHCPPAKPSKKGSK